MARKNVVYGKAFILWYRRLFLLPIVPQEEAVAGGSGVFEGDVEWSVFS